MSEENSIAVEATATNTTPEINLFELNDTLEKEGKATSKGKKVTVVHEINRLSLKDLQYRDSKQPYRSQEVGEDTDQVLADLSGKVDVGLYNKLVVRTSGYKHNVLPDQSPEDRELALNSIPSAHKISIIQDLTKVSSEIIYDGDEEITEFVWSEDQTYRVRTEIGGNAEFVAYSEIKEPSQRQIELYTGATKFFIERPKGSTKKPITKITVDLLPATQMFDELVQSVDGLSFNGNPVDVSNKQHLAAIDAYFKRSVIDAVMKETKLDLGE
jgi:hypothetical protein